MVEMDFPFPEERAGFDTFYADRISMLLSIDGFLSAQRFEANSSVPAPFLAVYEIASPGVLTSAAYASKAGPAAVPDAYKSKFRNWNRNLFTAPHCDLSVPLEGWMMVIDRLSAESRHLPDGYIGLTSIGLDRSIVERGIHIDRGGDPAAPEAPSGAVPVWRVRTMKPLHAVRKSNDDASVLSRNNVS